METYGKNPISIKSDSHSFYKQIKKIFPKSNHVKVKCLNNKSESSHDSMKQRYQSMRGFKNFFSEEIFLNCFEQVYNFFRSFKSINYESRNLYKKRLTEFNKCFI